MAKGTIIVTGANGGLGNAIAESILAEPKYAEYHAIFTVRDIDTADSLKVVIARHKLALHRMEVVSLNLGSIASARAVVDDINERIEGGHLPPIRALIFNAGWEELTTHTFTEDGFDMTFQVNYLANWLLTMKLLQSMDKQAGRIVVLGSSTHDPYDPRHQFLKIYPTEEWKKTLLPSVDDVAKGKFSPPDGTPEAGMRRYGSAKLSMVMMIHELQTRLDADPALSNLSILGVDPGAMGTTLLRRQGGFGYWFIVRMLLPVVAAIACWWLPNGLLRTTTKSASDVLRAAFDEEELGGGRSKGRYFNGSEPMTPSRESVDEGKRRELWAKSVEYTGLTEGETVLKDWR